MDGKNATHIEVKLKDKGIWYYNIVRIYIWNSEKIKNF
jgi:hypothetical protein